MRGSSPVCVTREAELGRGCAAQLPVIAAAINKPMMPKLRLCVVRPLDGYPSLTEDIASDPDRTSLVFRRFDKLAVRNLLYLQSELVELEAKQVQRYQTKELIPTC
jgi:hypothetical protein